MRIKIVIDGAEGMEDAARRIADLLDRVDRIRGENERERSQKSREEFSRWQYERQKARELAAEVAKRVFEEMKQKESEEKSPAGDTARDEGNAKTEESRNDGEAAD